jgi:hypothetical protein
MLIAETFAFNFFGLLFYVSDTPSNDFSCGKLAARSKNLFLEPAARRYIK